MKIPMIRIAILLSLLSPVVFSAEVIDPQKLLTEWQICQFEESSSQKCLDLRPSMLALHDNVELIQSYPQQMGLSIMNLQVKLSQNPSTSERIALEQDLGQKLATVGWLESPK